MANVLKAILIYHEIKFVFLFQEDFKLMCGNCMTYNPEDTIFYQAAKKLLVSGLKLIAKVTHL